MAIEHAVAQVVQKPWLHKSWLQKPCEAQT
jgi:hypothetical protein